MNFEYCEPLHPSDETTAQLAIDYTGAIIGKRLQVPVRFFRQTDRRGDFVGAVGLATDRGPGTSICINTELFDSGDGAVIMRAAIPAIVYQAAKVAGQSEDECSAAAERAAADVDDVLRENGNIE